METTKKHVKHILQSQQFDRIQLDQLFRKTAEMKALAEKGDLKDLLKGKILATLFFEPSTRTRLSFESAMLNLGGSVISTENAREFSSAAKGEMLEDTIRVVDDYADIIALRHYESGAAERAARVSAVPIINAGDGPGQHPTQALLDLFTIEEELGCIDGITIALVGDLLYGRTVRSLCYFLGKNYHIKQIFLVAPDPVRIKDDIKDFLQKHGVSFKETADLESTIPSCDVVYQTRIQKERFGDQTELYDKVQGTYIFNRKLLDLMPRKGILMHPLPRVGEIDPQIDDDPRSAYFRQARNGKFVRMAILADLLT